MNSKKTTYLFLFLAGILILFGCEPTIDFQKTRQESNESLTSIETVKSYSLRFNPKANGVIIITLNNGAEYKAEKLNSAQLSSLLALLQNTELKFDTKNEEFVLNK